MKNCNFKHISHPYEVRLFSLNMTTIIVFCFWLGTPRSEGRSTPRSGKQTPRSTPRSTRTNMSPSSMILGDATPLYDESV